MSRLSIAISLVLVLATSVLAQSLARQNWQSATISSDTLSVECSQLLLPFYLGRLLEEPNPTTAIGEMHKTLSSSHEIKITAAAQTGVADNLTAISGTIYDGCQVMIAADTGDTITVVHTPGSIELVDGVNVALSGVKILTLVRKGSVWVPTGSGGGGSGGGNITVADGQTLTITADNQNANEGIILKPVANCASAITFGQLCPDSDDHILYVGTGTGIVSYSGGGGTGSGCTDANDCFAANKVVDNLDGESNSAVFKGSSGSALKLFEGAQGMELKCVTDYGTGSEAACVPSELKTTTMSPGRMAVDGSYCVQQFNVLMYTLPVPVVITCADNNAATIYLYTMMPDRWDGVNLKVYSSLHTAETSPAGNIRIDWTGFCVIDGDLDGGATWATETSNGYMLIALDGHDQHDEVTTGTAGNVPLNTKCTNAAKKGLWLRGQIDASATTADDSGAGEVLADQYFKDFAIEYGLKAYTD